MNIPADVLGIAWAATAIALFFLLMRLLGGYLAGNGDGGGLGASLGKGILALYP